MEPLLTFNNVELYYDHVYALKGVSLEVNEGETVALIGANGAGKSSILRAITRLRRIRNGEIRFRGQRIDQLGPDEVVRLGIAMAPEGRRVFAYMSVSATISSWVRFREATRSASASRSTWSSAVFRASRSAIRRQPVR